MEQIEQKISEIKAKPKKKQPSKADLAKQVKELKGQLKEVRLESPSVVIDSTESHDKIKFFSESDIDPKTGKIVNAYPVAYNLKAVDDLREELRRFETMKEDARTNPYLNDKIGDINEKIRSCKSKLDIYENSQYEINKGESIDRIARYRDELGDKIGDSYFTRSEMMKGTADAHEEARRMSEPCIELSRELQGLAHSHQIPMSSGKVSRDNAIRIWKLCRNALGENRDAEVLRRD